jgi:MFS transporter, ACS family, glucarate transporter
MAATNLSSADLPGSPPDASRVRYGVLGYLCALSFILYIDRVCISKAATPMMQDLELSQTEMGFVFGAFTVAYGLFEVPTGRWGDRYGSRGVLTRIVLWWSAFTALTGCVFTLDSGYSLRLPGLEVAVPIMVSGYVLLLVVRFLFGAGEAGALPNSARVIARWFPPGSRGPAQGLITTSALVGGAVAPVIAAYLIQLAGWRLSFVIFGALGLVWAAAFYLWFRDDPARHPGVNEAELRLISAAGKSAPLAERHPPVPWGRVLTSANVWLLGGVSTCTSFVSYMYFSWYPTYLEKGRQVDNILSGWLSSLVLAGGALGCVLGGYLTDFLTRRTNSRRWGRRLIGVTGLITAAVLLTASVRCKAPVAAALLTAGASLTAFTALPSWWAVVTEISGQHLGALFGLMNSLGVPGAVLSQIFFGWFADRRGELGYTGRDQWDPGFYVYSGVLLIAALGWLFIDATRSAVEPRPDDDLDKRWER